MNYRLSFYVPESHIEEVKNALFNIGAGKQGDYDLACWQCLGQGQFRPLVGANPAIGESGELTYVSEYKVEMLCPDKLIRQAIETLKQAHPYEEPAYSVVKLEDF
ncbi:NGG1p interacting factor NIF3 [Legionella impletisoli]|uniref:NIF3 1 n=1 Tax=Legionella impletisoli TaxID=343510 RepID=A0A917NA71_9GAMM|nr:NGG1p interacting factor NIF3 [Legionella impletisoli]GGI77119.1 NIF3 1 [Legionella impletisoli]